MLSTDRINITVQRGTNCSKFRVNFVKPYKRLDPAIAISSGFEPFEYPPVELPHPRGLPANIPTPPIIPNNVVAIRHEKQSTARPINISLRNSTGCTRKVTLNDKQHSMEPKLQSDQPISRHLRPRSRIQQPKCDSDSDNYTTTDNDLFTIAMVDAISFKQLFITHKELSNRELAIRLRVDGKINTAGAPFELSDIAEIDGLLARGVLVPTPINKIPNGCRIFGLRMVREIKDKTTAHPYEKSRLVVQGYNDHEKRFVLTQSPTIQPCSQRLILAVAPTLLKIGMIFAIRDITQAYTQSKTPLTRDIFARFPSELKEMYPEGIIFCVV